MSICAHALAARSQEVQSRSVVGSCTPTRRVGLAAALNNGLPLRALRALALRFAPVHAFGTSATLERQPQLPGALKWT